jgi:cytochrome c553
MRYRGIKLKAESALLAFGLAASVFITGCGDNKGSEESSQKAAAPVSAAAIEIVANENIGEIKVQEKGRDVNLSKSYYYDYNIKSAYDQNAKPANVDASVRVKPRTAIEANMNVRSPYEKVQVSMLARQLSKKFIVKCSACHNDYANGVIGPSLLGKDSDFIFNAIMKFKNGEKENVLMTDLIKMMDDKEIKAMADEIYQFNVELEKMRNR